MPYPQMHCYFEKTFMGNHGNLWLLLYSWNESTKKGSLSEECSTCRRL